MLNPGNDNDIYIRGFRTAVDGAYINDALWTFVAEDASGVPLGAAVSMDYVAASNGHYRGVLPASYGLTNGTRIKITGTCSNYAAKFVKWHDVQTREE